MREIKFRAFFKGLNEVESFSFENISSKMCYNNDEIEEIVRCGYHIGPLGNFEDKEFWKHFSLMQSTGLKDKNGKEIYEGDIISGGQNYEVFWDNGLAGFLARSSHTQGRELNDSFEIIGNIYENPELLKEGES